MHQGRFDKPIAIDLKRSPRVSSSMALMNYDSHRIQLSTKQDSHGKELSQK